MILQIGKRARERNKGFTFIELVLVTIIMLILLGFSTPFFKKPFANLQLKRTTQDLMQLMRYVQAKAIAQRELHQINLDFSKSSFWASIKKDDSSGELRRLSGRWGKTFQTPEGISIASESSVITFYPNGSSDKAEIKISNITGEAFIITTDRTIKYAEFEE